MELVIRKRKWSTVSAPRCKMCDGFGVGKGPYHNYDLPTFDVYTIRVAEQPVHFCSRKCVLKFKVDNNEDPT